MEVVCGPMFAGKSSELLRRYERALRGRQTAVVLRHASDTRGFLRHGDGQPTGAIANRVSTPQEVLQAVLGATDSGDRDAIGPDRVALKAQVVLLDEAQFFEAECGTELVAALSRVERLGGSVTCFGLDRDAAGRPFGVMPVLMAHANRVTKLTAVCQDCGADATCTQRLRPGTTIGASGDYAAVCGQCWFRID